MGKPQLGKRGSLIKCNIEDVFFVVGSKVVTWDQKAFPSMVIISSRPLCNDCEQF